MESSKMATVLFSSGKYLDVREIDTDGKDFVNFYLPRAEFIFAKSKNKLQLDNGFENKMFFFDNVMYTLYHKNLKFFPEPIKGSENSQAIYYAEKIEDGKKYLLQFILPRSSTSRHYHKETDEIFCPIYGCCFLNYESMISEIRGTERMITSKYVPRNTRHQLKTVDNVPALNLIQMDPAHDGWEDHYYD
jgi:hypothetical protein